MNSADILVVVVVVIFTLLGYSKGFVLSVFRLISFVGALVLSYVFRPTLAQYLLKTPIYENIKEGIKGIFTRKLGNLSSADDVQKGEKISDIFKDIALPQSLKGDLGSQPEMSVLSPDSLIDWLSTQWATTIVNVLSFFILFVSLVFIFIIVRMMLKGVVQLPVIKQMDKIGGMVIGVIESALVIYVIFAFSTFMYSIGKMQSFVEQIHNSTIAWAFYDYNWIMDLFNK